MLRKQNILPASVLVIATALVGYNASNASEITSQTSTAPETILYSYLEKDVVTEKASDLGNTASYQTVATLASASTQNIGFEVDTPQTDFASDGNATFTDQFLPKPTSVETVNVSVRRNGELVHTVQPGETLSTIAAMYNLKLSTVLWENGLYDGSVVRSGDKLTILPVDGIRHKVGSNQTVESLAKLYQVKKELIVAFNNLEGEHLPSLGTYVTIPGGIHPNPAKAPVIETPSNTVRVASASRSTSAPAITQWSGSGNRFAYGYCTYWVASKRRIPWRGHAKAWIAGARAYGFPTGKTAKVGAVYAEPWLTGYGHVAYVERVNPDGSFTISEMNYAGWNRVSYRTIGANAPGTFIY